MEGKTWQENKNLSKFEKEYISVSQISLHVTEIASKKARLSETEKFIELWHEEESLWNILSDNYKIRQEKERELEECQKNQN